MSHCMEFAKPTTVFRPEPQICSSRASGRLGTLTDIIIQVFSSAYVPTLQRQLISVCLSPPTSYEQIGGHLWVRNVTTESFRYFLEFDLTRDLDSGR